MSAPAKPARLSAAIYARKSTTMGLEMDFNSLDAQREACAAYVQRQPGWTLVSEPYEDGGFSGATIERPAFQRLLADIDAKRIDVVVVYKVDRLSRSLLDFAKLMERFSAAGTSFVSVTQNFSTADAMGRLTLNMVMSFAEFEREMISERTRDKVNAARRRGKWTGGVPPLGYDVVHGGGKLAVNEDEAEQVRAIFQLYAEEKSLLHVVELLNARGSRTKSWVRRNGQRRDGARWDKSSLRKLLTNVVYVGRVAHRGEVLPGEQPGIVDADLFARVGELLRGGQRNWQRTGNKHGFLLRGLVHCTFCHSAMTSVVSAPRGKPYRYYSCTQPRRQGPSVCPVRNVSAAELERFVVERIKGIGKDPTLLQATLDAITSDRESQKPALEGEQRRLQVEREQCRRDAKGLVAALAAQTGDGRSITERLAELDERTGQIDVRLVELDAALAAIARVKLDGAEVATALASFDPVWEVLRAREQAELLQQLIERVEYDGVGGGVTICFRGAVPGVPEQVAA